MRATRLVTILLMLQERGQVTAAEVARALEVSVRTVYRDMEALSSGGIPIYAERGVTGGFRLLEGYRPHLGGFTTDEVTALWMLGDPPLARALGLESARASAALKLIGALPEAQRAQARAASGGIHITDGDPPAAHHESWLRGLRRAAVEGRVVRIALTPGAAASTEFEFEPLGLVRAGTSWHGVGRQAGSMRSVALADIAAVSATAGRFLVEPFDIANWWKSRAPSDTRTPR
ncbi:MAG: HTH domain-containing protein [Chloroflexi bacterium]|nr:HTH domain-containing protein [Chloroflexota bacterium]